MRFSFWLCRFEVTEIQFLCIGLHLISTICGSDVWNIGVRLLTYSVPLLYENHVCIYRLLQIPLAGITLRGVTVWIMVLGTIINMLTKLAVILGGGPGRNGSAVGYELVPHHIVIRK